MGSFPSTRKDSPPNLSKSNKVKATAACLECSRVLQAMQAGPTAQHRTGSRGEKWGENPPGKGQWERSLLLKYSTPTLCKSTRPKQFSSPGHCLSPCTHPSPTEGNGGTSPGPCSLLPIHPAPETHLNTFQFLYNESPSTGVLNALSRSPYSLPPACLWSAFCLSHGLWRAPRQGQYHQPHFQSPGWRQALPQSHPTTATESN